MTTLSLTSNPGNTVPALPVEPQLTAANQLIIPGQAAQLPLEADNPMASVPVTPADQSLRAQPLVEGRFVERLLLNPQSIPDGEQRLFRQQLQQRLASSDVAPNSPIRHQLVATLLAGADGLPLINPQLQQQLERKQTAAVANQYLGQAQAAQQPADLVVGSRPQQRDQSATTPRVASLSSGQQPADSKQFSLAIERALTGDPHGLQQLAQQLVTASQQARLPEQHQLLVLATLLLDESDPPFTTLDPRARRRLGQQLLAALKPEQAAERMATAGSVANSDRSSERFTAARQAITQGAVQGRWSEQDEEQSLPPELLWSGLGVAPATVKLTQVEAVLESLVDKNSLGLAKQGPLHAFIGQASMDQLLMVVTTLMIKINNISATFMVQSQKINATASDKIMDNQLCKQVEEAKKAQEAQENAKKGGLFSVIFSWVAAIATTVWAVMTCNPVAVVGALAILTATVLETVAFTMGSDAPEWMSQAVWGLTIAGSILSCGISLLGSAGKAALSAGSAVAKTLAQQGVKAALKQLGQGMFKAISKALKKLVEWFKGLPAKTTETLNRVKNFGKSTVDNLKAPMESTKRAGRAIVEKSRELVAPGNRLKTVVEVAKAAEGGTKIVLGGIGGYYTCKGSMLQAEISKLQNESWLLDALLEYYQKQRKVLQQGMSDLYRQEGDASAIASDLLKESAGLQNRIAGSLA